LLVVFTDLIDGDFAANNALTQDEYEFVDKLLDYWWYLISFIFVYTFLPEWFWLLSLLFAWRTVGEVMFSLTRRREYLFIFANFYENFFIFFTLQAQFPALKISSIGINLYIWSGILVGLKLLQEWFIHIAKLSIREDFFKWKRNWK
jgi:phosphatidylglycerophosphate synthase